MIRGEQMVDIRDFGVVSPTVLMLRIYPDVVAGLQIEAEIGSRPMTASGRRTHEEDGPMGLLLVFAVGYVMGARAGSESLDEVVDAVHAIRESEEFHDLVSALRSHAAHSLRGLATMLENEPASRRIEVSSTTDLLDRVRLIVGRR